MFAWLACLQSRSVSYWKWMVYHEVENNTTMDSWMDEILYSTSMSTETDTSTCHHRSWLLLIKACMVFVHLHSKAQNTFLPRNICNNDPCFATINQCRRSDLCFYLVPLRRFVKNKKRIKYRKMSVKYTISLKCHPTLPQKKQKTNLPWKQPKICKTLMGHRT